MIELENKIAHLSRKQLIKAVLVLLCNENLSSDHIALNRKVFEDQLSEKLEPAAQLEKVTNVKKQKTAGSGRKFDMDKYVLNNKLKFHHRLNTVRCARVATARDKLLFRFNTTVPLTPDLHLKIAMIQSSIIYLIHLLSCDLSLTDK